MTQLTIQEMTHRGTKQWCVVDYAGMKRCYDEEWQAQWHYSYYLHLKSCGLEPARAPDAPHT